MPNITGIAAPVLGNDKNIYSNRISDSFDAIDAHDHSTGKGVQVDTGGIADSAIIAAKIASDAVTTAKILNDAITTAKILNDAITTAKLLNDAVTTAKILNANVTRAKLEAVGQQVSTSCGNYSNGGLGSILTDVDIPNLEVTLTTTGRPVMIMLISEAGFDSYIEMSKIGGAAALGAFKLYEVSAGFIYTALLQTAATGATGVSTRWPPGCLNTIIVPAAGTHTYRLSGASSETLKVQYCKLVAFEL